MSLTLFNKLRHDAYDVSYSRFRTTLKRWLTDNPFYGINEFYGQVGTFVF